MYMNKRGKKLIIGPNGQMVQVKSNASLKPGWRDATPDDVEAKQAAALAAMSIESEG